jgi:hypothetical protein
MIDRPERSLRCEGMPQYAAHLLALLQSVCPADLSGGGSRADLLRELSDELGTCNADHASAEVGRLHDQLAALIDAQYERAGGHTDWSSTWLPLAILGPKNEPGVALETLEQLCGWKISPRLQRVDLSFRPGASDGSIELELYLRTNSSIALSEADFGRMREQLEPLGVKWRYSRATESLHIERPAVLTAPRSADVDMFLDGKAPEWVLMAVEHGVVEQVQVTYPVAKRPRTGIERIARAVVLPRPMGSGGEPRTLSDIMKMLAVPEGHWRCHLMQVGHAQEWAPVIIEYLRKLDSVYRPFAADGKWHVEQASGVIARHLSLSSHLELFPAEVGIEEAELDDTSSAIAATFEMRLGRALPRATIVPATVAPSALLNRLGHYESVLLTLKGVAARLEATGSAVRQTGGEISGPADGGDPLADGSPEDEGGRPTGESVKVERGSRAPADSDPIVDLPEASGFFGGADFRKKAEQIIRSLHDQLKSAHATSARLSSRVRDLELECDRLGRDTHVATESVHRLTARVTRRAALLLTGLADALRESTHFADWLRSSHRLVEELLFGWARSEPSEREALPPLSAAVSEFARELLRQVVSANDPTARGRLLGAFCYLVMGSDALNDRAYSDRGHSGVPLGLAEDLELAVNVCASVQDELSTWQARIRDAIDEGDGVPLADDDSMTVARCELDKVTGQLLPKT